MYKKKLNPCDLSSSGLESSLGKSILGFIQSSAFVKTFYKFQAHRYFCLHCIPEYGDFSTAEIGSHRLMNIFLIFFSLVPKINRHGLMLCHVMPIRF